MNIKETTPSEEYENDYNIWGLVSDVQDLIAKARTIELSRHGLSREQSHLLRRLNDAGGTITLNELAASVFRAHNSVSAIVSRMVKSGLVTREKEPQDRQYKIRITDKGKKLFNTMPRNSLKIAFSVLSPEEKQVFAACLKKLEEKTKNMLGLDYETPF